MPATTLRFEGRILEDHIKITIQDHPTLNWNNAEDGTKAKFDVVIENNRIAILFESNKSSDEHIQQATIIAIDLSQAAVSLASFREAEGITAILETVRYADGTSKKLIASDERLKGIANAIDSNEDMVAVLRMMMTDPVLMLAVRDLADSIQHVHTGAINCGRVVDAICMYFIPEGKRRDEGWAPMRSSLNIGEAYLKDITDFSKAPRHGSRRIESDPKVGEIGIKTWKVMNRFLEYRKRGGQKLSSTDFPVLE